MGVRVIKSADVDYADIGDLIIYTIEVINDGDVSITDVKVTDNLPVEVMFIEDLVFIDEIKKQNVNPATGILVGTIAKGMASKIKFQVAVKDFFPYKNINNKCSVSYKESGTSNTVESNIATTTITKAYINISKAGDTEVPLNGAITYVIKVENVGNTNGTNLTVRDILDQRLNLALGTVKINGVLNELVTIPENILVGNINSGETKSIEFKVNVGTLPVNTVVENVSDCFYTYTTNPNDVDGSYGTFYSNFIKTKILNLGIEINKVIDKTDLFIGEIGKCILEVKNIGQSVIDSINLNDPLNSAINFVAGSLNVNGGQSSGNIEAGVNIGNLAKGEVKTIDFNFNVIGPNANITVSNIANATYLYNTNKQGTTFSNEAELLIKEVLYDVDVNKIVTPSIVNSKDKIIYTITVKNNDTRGINNVFVIDTVPTLISVSKILVDSIPTSNTIPALGINLGTVEAGAVKVVQIEGDTKILENTTIVKNKAEVHFDDFGAIKRTITTSIVDLMIVGTTIPINIWVTETSDKETVKNGEEVTYTTTIKNNGPTDIKNLIEEITLGQNQTFVPGSLKINGVTVPNGDLNSINLGDLANGSSVKIEYKTSVIANLDSLISQNNYKLNYNYGIENNSGSQSGKGASVTIKGTKVPVHGVKITKVGDKEFVGIGDIITYEVVIGNTGEVDLQNIIFIDTIALNTTIVEGTLKKDGQSIIGNIETGINIGSLNVGKATTIEFKVEILKK